MDCGTGFVFIPLVVGFGSSRGGRGEVAVGAFGETEDEDL